MARCRSLGEVAVSPAFGEMMSDDDDAAIKGTGSSTDRPEATADASGSNSLSSLECEVGQGRELPMIEFLHR